MQDSNGVDEAGYMTHIHTWFGDLEVEGHTIIHSDVANADVPAILVKLKQAGALGLDKQYRDRFRQMAIQSSFVSSESDYLSTLRTAAIAYAKMQIIEAFCQPDVHIIQLIDAIDDLDEAVNLLSERLSEWRLPELDITSSETDAFSLEPQKSDPLAQELALSVERLHELRGNIADTIVQEMQALAPNTSNVAGELLGARLIAAAGGLGLLARMPSSRIQVVGASKALFRHLKYKSKPPKHGLIFQHPLVRGSPVKLRGKAARLLAAKIAIAARLDFYSKEIDPDLAPQLEKKISELVALTRRS